MTSKKNCFKAYDIRGRLGSELDEHVSYNIGRAYAHVISPKQVVLGSDSRLSSESIKLSLAQGLMDSGVNVIDIGLSGTEEIYFATSYLELDGGIEITASHNPIDYNGMKLVSRNSAPISRASGLQEMEFLVDSDALIEIPMSGKKGVYEKKDLLSDYVSHILSFIDINSLGNLKIVINSGNGAAGHVIDAIQQAFRNSSNSVEIIKINNDPDGHFPKGIPNPLLPECREETRTEVLKNKADIGIAFDGDFDRCFFFDENGNFIEGYYIVGLLAQAFLEKKPGSKIIHDPRLTWNTIEIVNEMKGIPIRSKTGHAYIKEIMRQEDAAYGGEMSAHHYFRDFFYCDSGMIPWLLVAELVSKKATNLSGLVQKYISRFPSSGEINRKLSDPVKSIEKVRQHYSKYAIELDLTDGLSMEFESWRFNLRSSNTEPLVRLNVESRGDKKLMETKTQEILHLLQG